MNALGTSYDQARSALSDATAAISRTDEATEAMARDLNHLAVAARFVIDLLNDLTTEQFQHGADRPARAELVRALDRIGRTTDDERFEYRDELAE